MAMRLCVFWGGYHCETIFDWVSKILGQLQVDCLYSLTHMAPGKKPALKSTLAWPWNKNSG